MTDRSNDKTGKTRDGKGRFADDPESAQLAAQVLELRKKSLTFDEIATRLGISKSSAYVAFKRGIKAIVAEPAEEVRALELEKLEQMEQAVIKVLERQHVTVSNGKVIRIDGQPLDDDAPILQAIDRLLRIQERRAKFLGLDAEKKINLSGGVTYEVVGVNVEDLT